MGDPAANPLVNFARAKDGLLEPHNITSVKETWIKKQLEERQSDFVEKSQIRVYCGTWNVNGKRPPDSLVEWLCTTGPPPDVYALGFQELDLTAEALILGETSRTGPWEQLIRRNLNTQGVKYTLLEAKQLVGMLLCIFVREDMIRYVADVKQSAAGVGILGMMGNKGGVAVRMKIHDSTLCFVNSHLSAHMENVMRRNQDYKDICRRVLFCSDDGNVMYTIFDHDQVFWLGDLNYRISMDDFAVRRKCKEGAWAELFARDQLNEQMAKGQAFERFQEAPINFAPTYKYDPGTTQYDTSEKHRTPAWCDRVLWYGSGAALESYSRHELLSSDHRPVSAVFAVGIKCVIAEKRSIVYQDLVKQLDKMENACMPDCVVSEKNVDLGAVKYNIPVTRTIEIENTGQVVARFRFIPKVDDQKFCKAWLWANPPFGMMIPNEKIQLTITALVDNSTAPALNMGRDRLEDIIVLHLEGGKDHYISISGTYLPSCFGSHLEHLIRHPLPVREDKPLPQNSDKLLSIPKEMWRIIGYIFTHGLDTVDLFLESGVQKEMEEIQELLDTGASFDGYEGSIDSMAETLIRFFESLAEPVVPTACYQRCIDASRSYVQCKQVISSLRTINYNVFYHLVAFLRELLGHSAMNKLTPEKLALLFSSVLVRPPPGVSESVMQKRAKAEFILKFLTLNEDLKVP